MTVHHHHHYPGCLHRASPKTSLCQEVQDSIHECYDNIDIDGVGSLNVKEAKRGLRTLGVEDVKRDDVRDWMSKNERKQKRSRRKHDEDNQDNDDDDELSSIPRDSFFRMACQFLEQQQVADKVFGLIDIHGKGVIVLEDLHRVVAELGDQDSTDDALGEEELQEMLEAVDTSGEGLLGKEDFYRLVRMINL